MKIRSVGLLSPLAAPGESGDGMGDDPWGGSFPVAQNQTNPLDVAESMNTLSTENRIRLGIIGRKSRIFIFARAVHDNVILMTIDC